MACPTPPSSARSKGIFMVPSNKMPYYEDIYGKCNEDEEFDRFADQCDDETSSEDEAQSLLNGNRITTDVFKPFTIPRRNDRSSRVSYDRNDTTSQSQHESSNPFKEFARRKRGSSTGTTTSSSSSQTQNLFKKFNKSRAGSTRNINSSPIDTEHVTSRKPKKLLTPKKYGMFSSPPASPESAFKEALEQGSLSYETTGTRSNGGEEGMEMEMTNFAGEAMDDLLRFGGLDNLDDGFPTLDEDVNSSHGVSTDPNLLPPATTEQSEFDGDVEDNTSETSDRRNNDGEEGETPKPEIAKRASSVVAVRKSKNQKPLVQPRRSLRQEKITQSKNAAEKQAGRRARRVQPSKTEPAELMAKNRSKMTARAVSLRTKAKTAKDLTVRSWKGEAFDDEGGSMIVLADEVDATEYIRR